MRIEADAPRPRGVKRTDKGIAKVLQTSFASRYHRTLLAFACSLTHIICFPNEQYT
jgi:hypothetical protein